MKILDIRQYFTKGDDTMSAVATNYVYEVKNSKNVNFSKAVVSDEMRKKCQEVAEKYPMKR
jgi:hypothetical protein